MCMCKWACTVRSAINAMKKKPFEEGWMSSLSSQWNESMSSLKLNLSRVTYNKNRSLNDIVLWKAARISSFLSTDQGTMTEPTFFKDQLSSGKEDWIFLGSTAGRKGQSWEGSQCLTSATRGWLLTAVIQSFPRAELHRCRGQQAEVQREEEGRGAGRDLQPSPLFLSNPDPTRHLS